MKSAYAGFLPVSHHFASQMNNEIARQLWSSINWPKQKMVPASSWRHTA